MDRPTYPSSGIENKKHSFVAKYPWRTMPIGHSFAVSYSETGRASLQTLAYKSGKRMGRKFRVVDHGPEQGYEVKCVEIGLPIPEKKKAGKKPKNVGNSPNELVIGWNTDLNKKL